MFTVTWIGTNGRSYSANFATPGDAAVVERFLQACGLPVMVIPDCHVQEEN